jgi:hypothetical protein
MAMIAPQIRPHVSKAAEVYALPAAFALVQKADLPALSVSVASDAIVSALSAICMSHQLSRNDVCVYICLEWRLSTITPSLGCILHCRWANLHTYVQVTLQFPDLFDEVAILQRLAYKNNNQHRSSKHHQAVCQVRLSSLRGCPSLRTVRPLCLCSCAWGPPQGDA